jgi:hypothetical protein
MSEPVSSTAGGIFGWKMVLSFGALIGSGILGGAIMAAFDPPKNRVQLFLQGAAAGVGSLFFGPIAVKVLDHYTEWVDLTSANHIELLAWAAPVYLVIGTLSWGVFAALAKLRDLIKSRGADTVARKIGLDEAKPTV